jgi:hypothetical protein
MAAQACAAPQSLDEALELDDVARRRATAMLASQSKAFSPQRMAEATFGAGDAT